VPALSLSLGTAKKFCGRLSFEKLLVVSVAAGFSLHLLCGLSVARAFPQAESAAFVALVGALTTTRGSSGEMAMASELPAQLTSIETEVQNRFKNLSYVTLPFPLSLSLSLSLCN
jgi:hypothetical protein